MKIVLLDAFGMNPGDLSWAPLEKLGDVICYEETNSEDRDEVRRRIDDCEILLNSKVILDRDLLQSCPNLRYIGITATGYNCVDLDACREFGITVTNIPQYSTEAVAQHTIALLLEACCQVGHHVQAVRDGRWAQSNRWCFWDMPLIELAGKTMGIIGYGAIGKAVGRIAEALGMKLLVNARTKRPELEYANLRFVDKETIFAQADVISLHCPLTDATRHLIDAASIAKMKDGVILLNTGRGPLIDEKALAEGLRSKKIHYAGLDVTEKEPLSEDSPLLKFSNCFITPHIAWVPVETRQRLLDAVVANLIAYLENRPINVIS